MYRSSTKITVWPAIADLMTIIVVLGVAAVLVNGCEDSVELQARIREARDELARLRHDSTEMQAKIERLSLDPSELLTENDSLRNLIRRLSPVPKCWEDINGNTQRVFRVEVYRTTFQLIPTAADSLLAKDQGIARLVRRVNQNQQYSWTALESMLKPILDAGRERIHLHPEGCRFYGTIERKEEMDAAQFVQHVNRVNQYIITGIPKENAR